MSNIPLTIKIASLNANQAIIIWERHRTKSTRDILLCTEMLEYSRNLWIKRGSGTRRETPSMVASKTHPDKRPNAK